MSEKADVVIVGGGIVGLCCAYYLRESGASVVVVDKGEMDSGASHVNAGYLVPSHIVPMAAPGVISQGLKWLANPESPFYIKPRIDLDLTKWLLSFKAACTKEHVTRSIPILRDLALASLDLFNELSSLPELQSAGPVHNGLLMLHNSEYSERHNLDFADVAAEAGLSIQRLNRDEALDMEPGIKTPLTGAVFCQQDASLDPGYFLACLRRKLEATGVSFRTGTDVTDFDVSNSNSAATAVPGQTDANTAEQSVRRVRTSSGEIDADHVVIAAGSWSGRVAKKVAVHFPLEPATGYSISVDDPAESLKIPLILTEEKITIGPMRGKIRFAGTLTLVGFKSEIDPVRVRPLERQVRHYFSDIEAGVRPMPGARSGFRPCSTDGLPLIGRPNGWKNLYIATGHGMLGFTQGPITGKTIADLVAGRSTAFDRAELSPDRFV